ncbi:MAG: PAS domain S-box protein, partial [Desulfobacterales bacterium]|nr:PAS domain S-box protein [Desulfobacterales bacterium]
MKAENRIRTRLTAGFEMSFYARSARSFGGRIRAAFFQALFLALLLAIPSALDAFSNDRNDVVRSQVASGGPENTAEENMEAGSTAEYNGRSHWALYRWPVVALAFFLLLETLLIAGLLIDRKKHKTAAERRPGRKDDRENEERFRSLVEQVKDYAIFSMDVRGDVSTWNSGAERIYGYPAEKIIGRHFSIFYTKEDVEKKKPWRTLEAASTQGQFKEEGWRVRKDGSRHWADVVITALREESRGLNGFSSVIRDITENLEAEEALNYRLAMEDLVTKISNSFINIPADEMDEEIERALVNVREFVGADRSYFCLLLDDEKTIRRVYESRSEGAGQQAENFGTLSLDSLPWVYGKLKRAETVSIVDITQLPAEAAAERELLESQSIQAMAAIPILLGKSLVGYFALNSARKEVKWRDEDIKLLNVVGEVFLNGLERRRAEEERLKMEADILEIRRKEMEARLKESETWAVIGRMAAGIAHDIRNPINYVSLALDHIARRRKSEQEEDPKVQRLFEGARSELIRASEMVQDLLDYGRTQTQPLEVKNGSELLVKSFEEISRQHGSEKTRILLEETDKEFPIRVEPGLFVRALVNLFENGLQAAGPLGEIRAGIGYNPQDEKEIVFWIQDSGPGIP